MWIKNVLKAFAGNTRVKYFINGRLIGEVSVAEFIDDGLLTYSVCGEGSMSIEDSTIIVNFK